ncbi:hypothetical protein JTE90_026587 [Oedothorax gibbosus]|uniref:Uncharacterized protein n=1 Tax=Oedothorax gibbosus TaxID=931172 RepID=A0AAV6TXN5_9ARAC|nr:hypothetical protein JTE90_026587 [Oedothorax gibbosus]
MRRSLKKDRLQTRLVRLETALLNPCRLQLAWRTESISNKVIFSRVSGRDMAAETDKEERMAVNGPVFFLIKEQAKSVVAIQALQSRMAVLESLQERLMQAINDVHQHLALSKEANTLKTPDKKPKFVEAGTKRDLSKSDSLNKDSGISSDSSLTNPTTNNEDDELLQLLELIDQKSLVLLKQVENFGLYQEEPDTEMNDEKYSSQLLDDVLFEKTDVHRQLSEVKAERDELRSRLDKLELATEAVGKQKLKIQQQLVATLEENQSLQDKIQHRASEGPQRSESLGYMADIEKASIRRKYLQYSEKSKMKVSAILKEGNILELQKQLLTYVMENDILRAKLQQDEPSKMAKWLKIEDRLRKDLELAIEGNKHMQEIIQSKELEIASLKDKIRCLQDVIEGVEEEGDSCVKNFGMASTEDWREPGVHNVYTKRSNLHDAASPFSPLGYGDFSKTQSLPANLLLDVQAKFKEKQDSLRANYGHVYDTGSFTEVPLNSSSRHLDSNAKDLVDLSSSTTHFPSSSSTLVQSNFSLQPNLGLSVPNLMGIGSRETLQNWAFGSRKTPKAVESDNGGAKLINGHLCWKGRQQTLSTSEDLSSICTEFDPLSDDTQSGENFVDSLNLSIPLKPTQVTLTQQVPVMNTMSQLSSIGDSLHSASLDIGFQNSSPTLCHKDTKTKMHKMHSARSVDGIREIVLENRYCKRSTSSLYGHSSVTPSRRIPVSIMNCMHESSDYSLL